MDDRDFEQRLAQLMKQDFSVGTEEFRDALLDKCLAVLNADDEGSVIDDDPRVARGCWRQVRP